VSRNPLASIITPVFNQRPYIEQTILSVLKQGYQNWEWIIIDDGSTDGTANIIRTFKDSRIKYTHQEHLGVTCLAQTFNKALDLCKGDLIAFLDSDDYWPAYKLDVQVRSFDDPDVILSYGKCCVVNHRGRKIGYIDIPPDKKIALNNPVGSALKRFMYVMKYPLMQPSTVMVKRGSLLNIGGFDVASGVPWDITAWVKLSLEGRFSSIPSCLGFWRRHRLSTNLLRNQEELFDACTHYLKQFMMQHSKRLDELGFHFDMSDIEKRWEAIKKEFMTYLPYNRALLMLSLTSFKDAQTEFKRFLDVHPSIKNRIIYYVIIASGIIRYDLVGTLLDFREKARSILSAQK